MEAALPKPRLRRAKHWIFDQLVLWIRPVVSRLIRKHSNVGDHPFFPNSQFEWISKVEAEWHAIEKEFQSVRSKQSIPNIQEVNPRLTFLSKDDRWKTYFFFVFNREVKNSCNSCPNVCHVLKQIPGLHSAFFSVLAPGKHIPAHSGKYSGLLRYHLGLRVPEPKEACRIRVGDTIRYWGEGASLLFDDTYDHEVWNDSTEERTVLIVDILRPLPRIMAMANQMLLWLMARTSFVEDGQHSLH